MSIRLLCTLTSNIDVVGNTLNDTIDDTTKHFRLQPEEGKKTKTSFVLNHQNTTTTKNAATETTAKENTNSISILKPCHLLLECISSTSSSSSIDRDPNSRRQSWLFGGLEIQSNSRNIEVYATESDEQQQEPTKTEFTTLKETYWQTCRGQKMVIDHDENEHHNDDRSSSSSQLIHNDNIENTNTAIPTCNQHHSTPGTITKEEWYKTIILPPSSKPTSILQLHLKLLSIRPSTCNNVFIRILKVKGRIPEVELESIQQLPAQFHQPEMKKHQSQVQSVQIPSTTTNDQKIIPSTIANQEEQIITNYMKNMNLKDITPTSSPHYQTTTNQYTNSINQDIAKAISGLTILIQNIHTTVSTSLSSAVGEMQKMVFDQYNTTHLQITSMEQSVQALKHSVDQLTSQVIHLQQEQQLRQKQQLQQLEDIKCQIIQEIKEQQNQRLHPTDVITKNDENHNQYFKDVITASVKEQFEKILKVKTTIEERDTLLQHELQIKAHIQQEREKLLNEVNLRILSSLKNDCKCHVSNDENTERKIDSSTNNCDEG